jgi:2-polyprenyl-3-methyl-5-hydroxy-6-metoxy-1,4-benzoquinol methylase
VYHDPGHQRRFAFLADLLVRGVAPRSVLDAGCGEGGLVAELRRAGIRSAGFEISSAGAERASARCPGVVFRSSLDAIAVGSDAVDVVTCMDVLEHVPVLDVVESVRELVRVAERYVVATINLDNVYEFHPTILSRESWNSVFAVTGAVELDLDLQGALQRECSERYPEYEFFVFRKLQITSP